MRAPRMKQTPSVPLPRSCYKEFQNDLADARAHPAVVLF